MKSKYIVQFIILFVGWSFSSCKDKVEEAIYTNKIEGVLDLRSVSTQTGVSLTWENPDSRKYDRVEVSYLKGGERTSMTEIINEKYSSVNINLIDANVYKFFVRAFSSTNPQLADEVSVKGRKLEELTPSDEMATMLNSVEIYGGDGGARVIWENPKEIDAKIEISFDEIKIELDANRLIKEYTISNLDLNKVYTMSVVVRFDEGTTTNVKTFTVKPALGFRRIENENWSIVASSEETVTENAPVSNLLDKNPSTYWRTKVSGTATKYPHYIIVDLKRDRKIQGLSLSRKLGDEDYTSWDNNISLSTDGVNYVNQYIYANASKDPNLIFQMEFNRTVEGEQMYLLPYVHMARYIRVDMVRGNKTYAVFGDLYIYGE